MYILSYPIESIYIYTYIEVTFYPFHLVSRRKNLIKLDKTSKDLKRLKKTRKDIYLR